MRKKILYFTIVFAFINFQSSAQSLISDTSEFKKLLDSVLIDNKKYFDLNTYQGIPKFIRKGLNKINKSKFKIANPGEPFNSSDAIIKSSWAKRQLIYACKSDEYVFVTYTLSGIANVTRSMIIRYSSTTKNIYWVINFIVPDHKSVDELIELIKYKKELLVPKSNI